LKIEVGRITPVQVLGFGASVLDEFYTLPAFPAAGGRLPILALTVRPGGQAATAMAACAAFGLSAGFAGVIGDDDNGARVRRELETRGVDISGATIAGTQPRSIVLVAEGAPERIVLWARGSARPRPLSSTRFQLLHIDDVYPDEALAAARMARDAGRLVTTDIDHAEGTALELIRAATHPVMAEHVPSALTGEADLPRALAALRAHTPALLIVTRGARGAVALDGDTLIESPGFPVEAIDTTGAGDVFRAGLITALLEGASVDQMLRFANAAAAASCERRGALDGVPTRARVMEVLASS
jgi:sugar/nucleoside kinase (ribokinase family)